MEHVVMLQLAAAYTLYQKLFRYRVFFVLQLFTLACSLCMNSAGRGIQCSSGPKNKDKSK